MVAKISIALSRDLLQRVRQAVGSGDYASTSEVIREALREWKARRPVEQGRAPVARKSDAAEPAMPKSASSQNSLYPLSAERHSAIVQLCERAGIRRLGFFGSVIRSDFDASRSDVDVVVEFQVSSELPSAKAYFDFKQDLEQLLGQPVDLVELNALRESRLRRIIERTQIPVYDQAA